MKNEMTFYRVRISTILFALLTIMFTNYLNFNSFAQTKKINFSGTWTLNNEKSQVGEGRQGPALSLTIDQKTDEINIERLTKRRSGEEAKSTEKITFDGKECENTLFENRKKKSTLKWSEDGKVVIISSAMTFERDGNQMEIKSTENFKLSDDGKSLTIDFSSTSSRGERKYNAVYDKK